MKIRSMDAARRYPVIFNPNARSQKGDRVRRFIEDRPEHLELYATRHAGHAQEISEKLAAAGEPVIVAAGGDGTLNEVVRGLKGTASVLGVLPAGTMNVFSRELGIPLRSLEKALEIIQRGCVSEVDLFSANGQPFVQMAGIGFDAMVIEETTWEAKKRLGPLAYLLAAVKLLGDHPPKLEIICADGRRETGAAVLAGNGALYGGQFTFFRKASNRDSMLDVLIYKESGYRLVLDSLRGLALGGIDLMASTCYLQTDAFTVRADREVPVQVDGEWAGRFSEISFRESPQRLKVLTPAKP